MIFILLIGILGCQSVTKDDKTDPGLTTNPSTTDSIAFSDIYIGALGDTFNAFRNPSGALDVTAIETQFDLDSFWTWHTTYGGGRGAGNKPDPLPTIDFTKEVVAVITDFIFSGGGHSITVVSAEYDQGAVTLHILKKAVATGCGVTAAFEQPYTVIKFDKPAQDFSIVSNVTTSIINCQ
jgi:hypothetical protein